jgi:heptosyltransferase-2
MISFDCRYFLGDRPCVWHKREGVVCTCAYYDAVRERILIIKLDAMGDVLRTTTLLPGLAKMHPHAAITWITRPESRPLLENNPYLAEVVPYGPDALTCLEARSFDRVINLDTGKVSAGLAAAARGARKDGFVLHSDGHVMPTNEAARTWLEMGLFDDLKKQNRRSYQSIMAEILGQASPGPYVLVLSATEQARARAHLQRLGMNLAAPILGLNTGAGTHWALKQWRLDGYQELLTRMHHEWGVQILLLGGKAERARHVQLRRQARVPVFDAGNNNSVRHFAALVEQCTVLVSGDTLGMHLALAMRRRIVVLFGPTSISEIELYGLGEKVYADMDCLCCYKEHCDFVPNCMDLISVQMVAEAAKRQLDKSLELAQPTGPKGEQGRDAGPPRNLAERGFSLPML